MAIDPVIIYPENFCPKCKSTGIEVYSWHNYSQNYAKMLKEFRGGNTPASLNKYTIYTMRCSKCGEKFRILWKDDMPTPMRGDFYKDLFMNEFKNHSIQGKPKLIMSSYELKMEE